MRVGFAGTPEFARLALAALADAGHELPLVLTQPDRPAGRGLKLQPSAVKLEAERRGLSLIQPRSLRLDGKYPDDAAAAQAALAQARLDVLVVAAYGLILPAWTLACAARGCLNIHGSLLPRWRGAAPVERALLAGDAETGVCLMSLEAGLDTGPIYDTVRVPIGATTTAPELRSALVAAGVEQLVRCLGAPLPTPIVQQGEPLYAAKILASDLRIDWSQPAAQIDRLIRVGGAWTMFRGKRVKVLAATLDEAGVRVLTVRPEGKPAMSFADFERGARSQPGEFFQ